MKLSSFFGHHLFFLLAGLFIFLPMGFSLDAGYMYFDDGDTNAYNNQTNITDGIKCSDKGWTIAGTCTYDAGTGVGGSRSIKSTAGVNKGDIFDFDSYPSIVTVEVDFRYDSDAYTQIGMHAGASTYYAIFGTPGLTLRLNGVGDSGALGNTALYVGGAYHNLKFIYYGNNTIMAYLNDTFKYGGTRTNVGIDGFYLGAGGGPVVYFDNYMVYDGLTPPIGALSNATWNVTSANVIGSRTRWNNGEAVNVSSISPVSLTFSSNQNANASCSLNNNLNYTSMVAIDPDFKLATTETTSHAYTLSQNLSYGSNILYCSMIKTDGSGERSDSHSGPLLLNVQDIYAPKVNLTSRYPIDLINFDSLTGWFRYNISDDFYLNQTWILTSKNSTDNIFSCNNGVCITGTQKNFYHNLTISGSFYNYSLDDNNIYGGQYNIDHDYAELTSHSSISLASSNNYLKTRILNVSNQKSLNFLEIMANSTGSLNAQIHYCNKTYSTGNPSISPYCSQIGSITPAGYNHTHSEYSFHKVVPFSIINNKTGDTTVTAESYFLIRGTGQTFDAYYLNNDTSTAQLTTNAGTTWANQAFTTDLHLHQFGNTDFFQIVGCANDSVNNKNCTPAYTDTFAFTPLPPSVPEVYQPSGVVSGTISINWTNSTPSPATELVYFSLDIVDLLNVVQDPLGNMTLNLSYLYDTSGLSDGSYQARVTVYTNVSLTSTGFSETFILDSSDPSIANQAVNSTANDSTSKVSVTMQDAGGLNAYRLGDNSSGSWNISGYFNITGNNLYVPNFTINTIGKPVGESIGYYFDVIDFAGRSDSLNTSYTVTGPTPATTAPYSLVDCPDTTPEVLLFIFLMILGGFFIWIASYYRASAVGILSSGIFLFSSFRIMDCFPFIGFIIMALSVVTGLSFLFGFMNGDW